jgi:hypothetical protein
LSEEFLRLAKKEINEELGELQNILKQCQNDNDIYQNSINLEKHLHKIKGLAPMMNQNDIGDIAKLNDVILKHVATNGILKGSLVILNESNQIMKEIFNGENKRNVGEFKNKIQCTFTGVFK